MKIKNLKTNFRLKKMWNCYQILMRSGMSKIKKKYKLQSDKAGFLISNILLRNMIKIN